MTKRSKRVAIAIVGAAAFTLAGCEEEKVDAAAFPDLQSCRDAAGLNSAFTAQQCETAFAEAEALHTAPSMATFEGRYGAERWTAIEGYYNPETRRMVYVEEPQASMEPWSHVYRGTSSSAIRSDVPTVYGASSEPEAPQSQAPLTWQRRHVGPWTTGGRADGGDAAAAAAAERAAAALPVVVAGAGGG